MTDEPGVVRRPRTRRGIGRRWAVGTAIIAVVAMVAIVGSGLLVLYALGGGPVPDALGFLRPAGPDYLAPSSPAESVLRTLRLAGYRNAVVGDADGTVVVRVAVPVIRTPADVELTWQTAMAAASAAYPKATRIAVQVFSGDKPLVEVVAPARDVAAAVAKDDAIALKGACSFRYLPETEQ